MTQKQAEYKKNRIEVDHIQKSFYKPLTEKQKRVIEKAVKKVVQEYSEALRMLGED